MPCPLQPRERALSPVILLHPSAVRGDTKNCNLVRISCWAEISNGKRRVLTPRGNSTCFQAAGAHGASSFYCTLLCLCILESKTKSKVQGGTFIERLIHQFNFHSASHQQRCFNSASELGQWGLQPHYQRQRSTPHNRICEWGDCSSHPKRLVLIMGSDRRTTAKFIRVFSRERSLRSLSGYFFDVASASLALRNRGNNILPQLEMTDWCHICHVVQSVHWHTCGCICSKISPRGQKRICGW